VWNTEAPVTPKPPPWTKSVDANVAIPVTPRVELAVNAPTEVSEVWNVDAPVTPMPPAVTKRADAFDCTPDTDNVEPRIDAPETPRPEPILALPETPTPPYTTSEPVVDDVEFVVSNISVIPKMSTVDLSTTAPLAVNPPVTPKPPAVIFTFEASVATPVTPRVDDAVKAPTDVNDVWNTDAPVTPTPPP
jgi:hypothetical protein